MKKETTTTKLLDEDVRRVIERVPLKVIEQMKTEGVIVAGGIIRSVVSGEKINDIDLFGDSMARLNGCADAIGGRKTSTKNAITVSRYPRPAVQYITRWLYKDPAELIESFDFTIARACIYWQDSITSGNWDSICDERFYVDLAARRLYYRSPKREEEAGGSLLRAVKFLKRGYSIQPYSLSELMVRVYSAVDLDKVNANDNLSQVIEGLLREVDPGIIER